MKSLRHFGLFFKLAVIMVALAAGPLTLVGIKIMTLNKEATQTAILELHNKIVEKLSDKINDSMENLDDWIMGSVIPQLGQPISWDLRQKSLKDFLEKEKGNIVAVALVDKNGGELLRAFDSALETHQGLINHAPEPAFQQWLKTGQRSSQMEASRGRTRLKLYYPLAEPPFNGAFALYVVHSLSQIQTAVAKEGFGGTGLAYLVDSQGRILAHRQASLIGTKADYLSIVQSALKASQAGSSFGSVEFRDTSGQEQVGAYAPVGSLDGAVVVQQSKADAYKSVSYIQNKAVYLLLAAIGLAALAAFVTARMVTRPVFSLIRGAEAVASGDFTQKVRVKTRDELQELAETFNTMIDRLKAYSDLQLDKIIAEKTKTEAIIFSIADGIIMTDHSGNIQLLNERARKILGLPDQDLQGQPISELWKDPQVKAAFEEITKEPEKSMVREIDLSSADYKRYYQLSAAPVKTPSKQEDMGIVTIYHDVTLEKELEQMKENFLHSITHDLRNPMTSIRGFLSFLQNGAGGPLNEAQAKIVKTIDNASFRLLGMINDILDVAKMESGKLEPSLELHSLREIVERVLEIQTPMALKKNLQTEAHIDPSLGEVLVDADMIERVITNIVGNAIKFTPDHGKITVTVQDQGEELLFSIQDTGEGIPPEYADKVFHKFQQAGARRGGTGLGLTICKYFVEAHQGRIWLESTMGSGTTFHFTLPKKLKREQAAA